MKQQCQTCHAHHPGPCVFTEGTPILWKGDTDPTNWKYGRILGWVGTLVTFLGSDNRTYHARVCHLEAL